MAKTINAAVGGAGCPNHITDVKIVQELLNLVPVSEGGTDLEIIPNGQCDEEFIEIIETFQNWQFSPPFERWKVTPGGQTITRLNTYSDSPALTETTVMNCPHGGMVAAQASRSVHGLPRSEWPLLPTDHCTIAGCPLPSRCARVKWLPTPYKILDTNSAGLCVTNIGTPQGSVVFE